MARDLISEWYSSRRTEYGLKTPNRRHQPYFESPADGKEPLSSPGFKGTATGVGIRESLQRKSKDHTNSLRSADQQEGDTSDSDQEGLGAGGKMGSSC